MTQAEQRRPRSPSGRVRLRTLVLVRWIAIAGQTAALLITHYGLGFKIPLAEILAVITISAWVNIFLMISRSSQGAVSDLEAAIQLGYDVLQLAALLALTGGTANPFLLLLIAPVAISAFVLRPIVTLGLAGLTYACIAALWLWRLPLPWSTAQPYAPPELYEAGLAAAVSVGVAFTAVFAWRVVTEEERLNLALAAVQSVLAREQKLSAVGALAAAAAHELGTPLATIHLVAKEMRGQVPPDSPLAEDVALLISQSERCRGILKQLTSQGEAKDVMHERLAFPALFDLVAGPHKGLGATIELDVQSEPGAKPLELRRSPEIIHGLGNLIENAVGFANGKVEVRIRYNDVGFEISVRDDGPGFPASVMPRLGEPYVSERSEHDLGGGLGLGFFIAKTLLERTGAKVEAFNRNLPATGAIVRARWARAAVEADPLPTDVGSGIATK